MQDNNFGVINWEIIMFIFKLQFKAGVVFLCVEVLK